MAGHEAAQSKLVEAAVFISHRSMDDPNFSTGKLTKLVYIADCLSYHENGSPITGATTSISRTVPTRTAGTRPAALCRTKAPCT